MGLRAFGLAVFLLAAGCTSGIAPDPAYVGDWRSQEMRLAISSQGMVDYERRSGGRSSKINAPIQAFEGANFRVGLGPVNTLFVVSRPPYKDGSTWKMVVDGVELRKVEQGVDPRSA